MKTEPVSKMLCFFKKIRWWTKSQKGRLLCQLTSVMLFSFFWISWPSKLGLIDFPEMSVRNYHFMLHYYLRRVEISHDLVMLALVWLCMVQFSASYAHIRLPHIFMLQIWGRTLVLLSNKYGISKITKKSYLVMGGFMEMRSHL